MFTAEPEITTTRVRKGDFLIMASDGLWDCITSEEAVGLVGIWLENNWDAVYGTNIPQRTNQPQLQLQSQPKTRTLNTTLTTSIPKVYEPHELPLESLRLKSNSSKDSKTGGNDRAQNYAYWRAQKRFVLNRDDSSSVAGHLARNALGGADRDLTEALLSFDVGGGRARKYRCVTFFFFPPFVFVSGGGWRELGLVLGALGATRVDVSFCLKGDVFQVPRLTTIFHCVHASLAGVAVSRLHSGGLLVWR